jgi:hypothetical protein
VGTLAAAEYEKVKRPIPSAVFPLKVMGILFFDHIQNLPSERISGQESRRGGKIPG